MPDEQGRLSRITGVEPDRWPAVREAIEELVGAALQRLSDQREQAAAKRERKVAAGRKGAQTRWGGAEADSKGNAVANANANGRTIATAIAEPMRNQWPPAPAPDEERYEEGLVLTRTHAREPIPSFVDRRQAGEWLTDHGAFPGDPAFNDCVEKAMAGTLDWDDVERMAA